MRPLLLLMLTSCGSPTFQAWLEDQEQWATMNSDSSGTSEAANDTSSTGSGSGSSSTSTDDTTTLATADDASSTSDAAESTSTGSSGEAPGPTCGDKLIEADEECDDGNTQDDDTCRNDCTRRWIVFVTSEPSIQGDFNGLIGADYQCRHRATKMFLPNGDRYMAWISTATVQPADRMHHARGPYVLVNGLQVAEDWHALTSGTLEHPINVNEMGETMVIGVWTGTDTTGLRLPNTQHCSDWTHGDSDQTGWIGDCGATDTTWTRGVSSHCGAAGAIYCIEQP